VSAEAVKICAIYLKQATFLLAQQYACEKVSTPVRCPGFGSRLHRLLMG